MHPRQLAGVVAAVAVAIFLVLTLLVVTGSTHGLDSTGFRIAHDLRAPWLDRTVRAVTTLGLIAVVGPAVVAAAVLVRRHRARAAALVIGCALAWGSVWIVKFAVDRPRPPAPLVTTSGASYPSAHAANSVGWLALALALAILIPKRAARAAAVIAGALVMVLVGLSRVYLRAHHLSDVLAGEALAMACYSLALIVSLTWLDQAAPEAISATASTSASTSDSSL